MKEINFEVIAEHVGTQYGDLTGVIQIDGHLSVSAIDDLCKDFSVDLTDKFIVGFGLSDSSILGVGENSTVACSILTADKLVYGNNYEAIEQRIKSDGGVLAVSKITVWIPYTALPKYIKRFDFLAMTDIAAFVTSIEISEEINDVDNN